MLKERPRLFQIGLGILILGVLAKIAVVAATLLNPLAYFAIIGGIILMVIGLVAPSRRR